MFITFCAVEEDETFKLTAVADIAGWMDAGGAEALLPPIQRGRLGDLFDNDPYSTVCCGENGRASFTFSFKRIMPVKQIGLRLEGGGVYRWRAETSGPFPAGSRPGFTGLFDWRYTKGSGRDAVPFRRGKSAAHLRIVIERLTMGREIVLSEIEFYTDLDITEIRLEHLPESPRLGLPFRIEPVAIDRLGGRLPLDEGVAWSVHPKEMLKIDGCVCTPRYSGKVRLCAAFGPLSSREHLLHVTPLEPAPTQLEAVPYKSSTAVFFKGCDPACSAYAVYARLEGKPQADTPQQVSGNEFCTLFGLRPGTTYYLSAAGMDRKGSTITALSEEIRIRTLPIQQDRGLLRIANIDMLVPIYTSGYTDEQVNAIVKGFELARLFVYRNSLARLNINPEYLRLSGNPVSGEAPGMLGIEEDLMKRGIPVSRFGAVHAVSKKLTQNRSGHIFKNGAVGSFGTTAGAPYPGCDPGVDYNACWTLVHEFQHTLDLISSNNPECPPILSGHFLENYPLPKGTVFDAGDFYDGQGEILRRFEGYECLPGPWVNYMEVIDSDSDGMPDSDPRLPGDEHRSGSDQGAADTDGDGSGDLAEFCAGLYSGSDPLNRDTDCDSIPDNEDPYPLSSFSGRIPFGKPETNVIPSGLLSNDVFFSPPGSFLRLSIHSSWDSSGVYFAFRSAEALHVTVHIDGSGHLGRFESDRRVHSANALSGDAPLSGDIYTENASLELSFGDPSVHMNGTTVPGAKVCSTEKNGIRTTWVFIPASLGPGTPRCHIIETAETGRGLTLKEGRILGLAFTASLLSKPENDRNLDDENSCFHIFETNRFYDAALVGEL